MGEGTEIARVETSTGVAMELSVEQVRGRSVKLDHIIKEVMVEGLHYGVIPGTEKPTLYSSGADILNRTFLFRPEFEIVEHVHDNDQSPPFIKYMIRCKLVHIPTGNVVAESLGSCNSHEVKYKYRGFDATDTGAPVPKDYWDLRKTDAKKSVNALGGPGFIAMKNDAGQWTIHEKGKRSVNEEVEDLDNTLLKMACKRAKVGAVHHGTACGDSFTQDLEDMGDFDVPDITYGHDKEAGKVVDAKVVEPKSEPAAKRGRPPKEEKPTEDPTSSSSTDAESPSSEKAGEKPEASQPTASQGSETTPLTQPQTTPTTTTKPGTDQGDSPTQTPATQTPKETTGNEEDQPPDSVYDDEAAAAAPKSAPATTAGGRDFSHLPKNLRAFNKVIESKGKFGLTLEQVESKWGLIDNWTPTICKEIAGILGQIKSADHAKNVIDNLQMKGATKEHAGGPDKKTSSIMTEGPDGRHYAVTPEGLCNPETGLLVYEKKPVLQEIGALRQKINDIGGEGSDSFYMDEMPEDLRKLSFNEIAALHDSLTQGLVSLQEA